MFIRCRRSSTENRELEKANQINTQLFSVCHVPMPRMHLLRHQQQHKFRIKIVSNRSRDRAIAMANGLHNSKRIVQNGNEIICCGQSGDPFAHSNCDNINRSWRISNRNREILIFENGKFRSAANLISFSPQLWPTNENSPYARVQFMNSYENRAHAFRHDRIFNSLDGQRQSISTNRSWNVPLWKIEK